MNLVKDKLMVDITASSVLSSSALNKAETITPVAAPRVPSVVAPTEFYVSPYTLIDSTTSKAILVLRDTSTGDIQVQVPAQVNIDSAVAAESLQRAELAAQASSNRVPEALQQQVIEPSAVVVAQQVEQQTNQVQQASVPVPEAVTAALSLGAQASQQVSAPQVSFDA